MIKSLSKIMFVSLITATAVFAADPTAYVLNTNGETLSKINLSSGEVVNDILTIGSDALSYPNQIVVRDTTAYVIASGTNEIQVINLNTEETSYYINTGASSNPYWMDFVNDHYLYVTLLFQDSIARVDYLEGTITGKSYIGKSPEGILINGDMAYIACTGFDWGTYGYDPGTVAVYDIEHNIVVDRIDVGLNPQYLAFDPYGRIHVVCTGDYFSTWGIVYIIDPGADTVVDSIYVGGSPGHISIGPDGVAYLAAAGWTKEGYVYSYDALTGEVFHDESNPIEVDLNCMTACVFQDTTVFTGSFTDMVNVIDSSGVYLESYAVGDGPNFIDFNYVPGDADGNFSINILDVTHIVNFLYRGGPYPVWPEWRANVNGDESYNLLDIVHIINFLYKGGERPKVGAHWARLY